MKTGHWLTAKSIGSWISNQAMTSRVTRREAENEGMSDAVQGPAHTIDTRASIVPPTVSMHTPPGHACESLRLRFAQGTPRREATFRWQASRRPVETRRRNLPADQVPQIAASARGL